MSSRSLNDLNPVVRAKAFAALDAWAADPWLRRNGITVIVTCTFRSQDEQAETYAQGRTREQLDAVGLTHIQPRPGAMVTWAVPGKSKHNHVDRDGNPDAEAFDVVALRHGKPVWGTKGNGIDDNIMDDGTDDLEVWQHVGQVGIAAGLKWAGTWPPQKREYAHFED